MALHEMRSTTAIGLTLTPIFVVSGLTAGVYMWELDLGVVHAGTPTAFTMTPGFTGTATNVNWNLQRYTASAVAASLHTAFQASASSVFIIAQAKGQFTVTALGDFTIGCTRTGGTSSTTQRGSSLKLDQVG